MGKLAINGGPPVATTPLSRRWPVWDDGEREQLSQVLESGKWWRGAYENESEDSKVGQFESTFARFQDAKFGLAVTNGTTALECAFKTVGVEAGDEVIVPAITFIATATAALQVGAVPVFVDVDPRNYTVDVKAVEAAITDRTRCIAPVDYGGMPCDYDALVALGEKHGIPVVADCAHAHGSQWKGKGCGAITEMGTFSFQAAKQLTTGEGGMVLTDDENLWERAYSYHRIGRRRGRGFYEHFVPASNLRMTEWQGAIGLAQLARFPAQMETRLANVRYLSEGIERLRQQGVGLATLEVDPRVTRWHFYMWHCKFLPEQWGDSSHGVTRDQLLKAMAAEGIRASTGHTQPLYKNPLFIHADEAFGRTGFPIKGEPYGHTMDYTQVRCPETERIYTTEAICLSHQSFLGPRNEMDLILEAMEKIWTNRHELREGAPAVAAG